MQGIGAEPGQVPVSTAELLHEQAACQTAGPRLPGSQPGLSGIGVAWYRCCLCLHALKAAVRLAMMHLRGCARDPAQKAQHLEAL